MTSVKSPPAARPRRTSSGHAHPLGRARGLAISPGFTLPLDAVTETFGILAAKRSGKSNAAVVMFEEMFAAGVPCVAVDPKGDWWGIRSSRDGTGAGLSIPVFGGRHGDVPLEAGAGETVADFILAERVSVILDVSRMTKADSVRFLTAFGRRLYDQADEEGAEPLHIFLEECHEYLPQVVRGDVAKLVSVWQEIVKWGGFKGLGVTMVSQRAAAVNKDALNMISNLVMLRTLAKLDRDAAKGWVEVHEDSTAILQQLPSMANGEAILWSPEFMPRYPGGEQVTSFRFRLRETYDSAATPKVGEKRRPPKTLADIDLGKITAAMAEAIERAEANDPDALRRQVAQLRRELATARKAVAAGQSAAPPPAPVVKEVKVPWPDNALVGRAEAAAARIERASDKMSAALAGGSSVTEAFAELSADLRKLLTQGPAVTAPATMGVPGRGAPAPGSPRPPSGPGRPRSLRAVPKPVDESGEPIQIKSGAMRILVTLARHYPLQLTRTQLATLAGFRIGKGSGTWDTYISVLRRAGYIDTSVPGMILIADAGLAAAGVEAAEPMTTEEVLEMWRSKLKAGARRMLDVLIEIYPDECTPEELGERSGLTVPSGTFDTYFSTLRRNGLMVVNGGQGSRKVRASDALFVAA